MNISSAKQARAHIGKRVWWDDHSSRYVFLRSGILNSAEGRRVEIDGNWLSRSSLRALRTTEQGGAFPEKIDE